MNIPRKYLCYYCHLLPQYQALLTALSSSAASTLVMVEPAGKISGMLSLGLPEVNLGSCRFLCTVTSTVAVLVLGGTPLSTATTLN